MYRLTRRYFLYLVVLLITLATTVGTATTGAINYREQQTTGTVLMVSPDDFAFNQETAKSNLFQNRDADSSRIQKQAMAEFNVMVKKLRGASIRVIRIRSRNDIKTPDAVFPNNWFSLHWMADGERILVGYPMLAPNRRAERRMELLSKKLCLQGFKVSKTIDLSQYEEQGKFLEGTGSMVLDRTNRVAYASLSPRTDREVLNDFSHKLVYRPVAFSSYDTEGNLIYHTNVMMSVGERFAIICSEAIRNEQERIQVIEELKQSGRKVITITLDQMKHMCGNILELRRKGSNVIVMSQTAFDNFMPDQKKALARFGKLLPVHIKTIETIGGGSARCMLGEVF